jgi:hypothetical protein
MNPLEQLAPLIVPPAVSWWPPAPGWWLLALLLVLLLAGLGWWLLHAAQGALDISAEQPLERQRQAALEELAQLRKPYDGAPAALWLQQLNVLLKRLCRAHYPDSHSHTMSGRTWLAFLDSRCPAAGLTRWMILVEGAYRGECRLDDKAVDGLNQAVEIWIRKHV